MVGAAFARLAATAGHEVIGLVGSWTGGVPGTTELHPVDLTDTTTAAAWVRRTKPDAIVNAAAVSEPAACETDPALSQTMNVALPARLAEAAALIEARFVHISSEQVFDGEQPPYYIDSVPRPLNLYGRQKLESEQRVLAANPAAAVVRAPLLLGNSLSGHRSVHEKLFELWAGAGVARLYTDEFRQVCSADNLAAALLELAGRRDLCGPLHWAGAELISRYALGLRLTTHFQIPENRVAAVWRVDTPAISAKRPANLALALEPLTGILRTQPQSLDEILRGLEVPVTFREWQRSQRP